MEEMFVKDRLRLLLKHFGDVTDPRDPAKVISPKGLSLYFRCDHHIVR